MKIEPEIVWEIIKQMDTTHPDYSVVVTFLSKFARQIERESPDLVGSGTE